MPQEQSETLWVVVEVQSGIPVTVEGYRNSRDAQIRESALKAEINPENDETGIFEVQIK